MVDYYNFSLQKYQVKKGVHDEHLAAPMVRVTLLVHYNLPTLPGKVPGVCLATVGTTVGCVREHGEALKDSIMAG